MFDRFSNEDPAALAYRVERSALSDTVYQALSETAQRFPQKPAWIFIDDGISRDWQTVLHLVDRAADALAGIGVGAGSHVAVMAWNIEEFPLTWLALAKLGATMVPINARYTASEVSYVLRTSAATHLVYAAEFHGVVVQAERPDIPDARLVVIGGDSGRVQSWAMLHDAARSRVSAAPADPDRLLNLQYTSGTTGFSKACMLTHRYWILLGYSSLQMFATPIERFYASLSFFYMVPQRILMNTIFAGGCIVFPRKPSAKRFMIDVARHDCEYCLPILQVLKEPPRPEDRQHRLKITSSSLSSLVTGEHGAFHRRFDVAVQNFYGMTEIGGATFVPAHRIPATADTGTIGVPTPFRQVGIFEADGRPMAQGDAGEICVKGPGMLRGYFGNEEATANAFRDGWFRTGDLGRVDGNGYFHIVGRLKDMVRRGGENIAAREVESVIRMLPEVAEVAILPVPDAHNGEEVKAYIQLRQLSSPETVPPEAILAHCAQRLAPFKVPRYLEYVTEFPLTDSNRVQKRKLLEAKPDLRQGSYDRLLSKWH